MGVFIPSGVKVSIKDNYKHQESYEELSIGASRVGSYDFKVEGKAFSVEPAGNDVYTLVDEDARKILSVRVFGLNDVYLEDVDGDGDRDLVMVGNWQIVKVTNQTKQPALDEGTFSHRLGCWWSKEGWGSLSFVVGGLNALSAGEKRALFYSGCKDIPAFVQSVATDAKVGGQTCLEAAKLIKDQALRDRTLYSIAKNEQIDGAIRLEAAKLIKGQALKDRALLSIAMDENVDCNTRLEAATLIKDQFLKHRALHSITTNNDINRRGCSKAAKLIENQASNSITTNAKADGDAGLEKALLIRNQILMDEVLYYMATNVGLDGKIRFKAAMLIQDQVRKDGALISIALSNNIDFSLRLSALADVSPARGPTISQACQDILQEKGCNEKCRNGIHSIITRLTFSPTEK